MGIAMSKNFKYLDNIIHSGIKELVLDSDIVLGDNEISDRPYVIKLDVNGLVIDGNGHSIDGQDKTCMFICTAENITIKNITIKNFKFENPLMKKDMWSAINNCGGLNIMDSIFIGNYGFGGAIYNHYGSLYILHCKFINNSAGRVGGAIYNDEGLIIINNSTFTNNESIHDGGAIYSPKGVLNIRNSEFSNNFAGYDGGAIYGPKEVLNLRNCTFKDNKYDDICKW